MDSFRGRVSSTRSLLLVSVLAAVLMLLMVAPAWASPAQADPPTPIVTMDSLGLTDPADGSVIVKGDPANSGFKEAVAEARKNAKVVFVLGDLNQLMAALDETSIRTDPMPGSAPPAADQLTVSYYATYPNQVPSMGTMVFHDFKGSYEDLLRHKDFNSYLKDVDDQYAKRAARGSVPLLVRDDAQTALSEAAGATLSAAGWNILYPWSFGESYPVAGRIYIDYTVSYLTGDNNPSYDYFYYQMGITSRPGVEVWPSESSWATWKHRWKFLAYNSGSSIVTASPSTTPGGTSVSVSLGGGGATMGWSYEIPGITIQWTDNRPSYTLWQHEYATSSSANSHSSCVSPGFVHQVPSGANSQTYIVGTMYWQRWLGFDTIMQSNCGNRVVTFSHP